MFKGRCPPRCYCQSSEGCGSIFTVQWSRKAEKNQAKIGANNASKVPRPAETAFKPVAEDFVAYTGEDTQIFKVFGVISPEKLVLDDLWSIWPVRLRPPHLGAPPISVDQFRRRKITDRYQLYILSRVFPHTQFTREILYTFFWINFNCRKASPEKWDPNPRGIITLPSVCCAGSPLWVALSCV